MPKVLAIQHIESEGLGSLEVHLSRRGIGHEYAMADDREDFTNRIDGYSALVLLGGPISAYDDHPFFKRENQLIRDAMERNLPILGICLGAQILARFLGGRVYRGKAKEIGWHRVRFEDNSEDKLFHSFGGDEFVFQWHGDTFDQPPNSKRLASSSLYPNQAFRFGRKTYAVQFHVEVTEGMIREWIDTYAQELEPLKGVVDPEIILKETPKRIGRLDRLAENLSAGFADLISMEPVKDRE